MKKITSIILIMFLFSCGSVKKTQTQTEDNTEITTDLTRFSNSYTLEPVNLDRPILVTGSNGKTDTIYNTRVIYNNSKETIKEVEKKDVKEEIATKEKDYSDLINIILNKILIFFGIIFLIYSLLNYFKNKPTN